MLIFHKGMRSVTLMLAQRGAAATFAVLTV
jgi:hypothetical protein